MIVEKISAVLQWDLSDQLRLAGFDDARWSADVCDNAAVSVSKVFVRDFRRFNGLWITRLVSDWELDD